MTWNTSALTGTWDVRLTSIDGLHNPAASTTVSVIVDNAGPTLGATPPANGAVVRGVVSVPFTASDPAGVFSTVLQYDLAGGGVNWQTADTAADPTTGALTWDTTAGGMVDGTYALQVLSIDTQTNQNVVSRSNIKVDNIAPSTPVFGAPASGATFGLGQINVIYSGGAETIPGSASGLAAVTLQTEVAGSGNLD